MDPWTLLGWGLLAVFVVCALAAVVVLGFLGLKVYREAKQHHTDAKAAARGDITDCGLCRAAAEFLTESGPRCPRHLTTRKPAGRKPYCERITSDA